MYRKAFCRTLSIRFDHAGQLDGLDAYFFELAEDAFDTDKDDPNSSCFCEGSKCLKKGLGNITPCYYSKYMRTLYILYLTLHYVKPEIVIITYPHTFNISLIFCLYACVRRLTMPQQNKNVIHHFRTTLSDIDIGIELTIPCYLFFLFCLFYIFAYAIGIQIRRLFFFITIINLLIFLFNYL